MKQYRCGSCGSCAYFIFQGNNCIVTECLTCGCKSMISIKAELDVDWYDEDGKTGLGSMYLD